ADFSAHLAHVARQLPAMQRYDWVVDNLNTPWSLDVCRLVAAWCDLPFVPKALHCGAQRRAFLADPTHKHVVHYTPKHGSWLNQVEIWFGVLCRRLLRRGEFRSVEELAGRILAFIEHYDRHHAHPYEWTYTGKPLVSGDARKKKKRLRYRRKQLVAMRSR